MKEEYIQTEHPEKGKQNKRIPLESYELVKTAILEVLKNSKPTHTELVEQLTLWLKDTLQVNISWYTMVVKLDLEARKIIERTGSGPKRYQVVASR